MNGKLRFSEEKNSINLPTRSTPVGFLFFFFTHKTAFYQSPNEEET